MSTSSGTQQLATSGNTTMNTTTNSQPATQKSGPPPTEQHHEGCGRRRNSKGGIQWDEDNLKENEEYMKAHPKMKIDEPKTPFHELEDWDEETRKELEENETWHHEHGTTARIAKMQGHTEEDHNNQHQGPAGGKVGLAITIDDETEEEKAARIQKEHDQQFKAMRRAVYADEGSKFKSLKDMMAKGVEDDEEEEEEDDDEKGK